MAVCCATLFSPTKGKSTWGVEIQQDNPILVDGRPLLPSLPSHRTFYADIRSRLGPSSSMAVRCSLRCLPIHHTLSADTLRESKLLPPFTRGQPSAGRGPRYQRRAIGDTFWTRPVLVNGRPLLPSLPSHPTLSADTLRESKLLPPFTRGQPSAARGPRYQRRAIGDTFWTRPVLVDGSPLLPSLPSHPTLSADTLRESKLLPPFTRGQPSAGRGPRYQRRAIGDTFWTRPVLVDGRPLLPSLPSHPTLSADTLSTRPFLVDGRPQFPSLPSHRTLSADTLRESKLLPPFTRGQPSAARGPRYQRRAIGDTFWTRPVLVDGRPLLPSLPSHRTLSADTLRESKLLPPFTRGQPSAARGPRYQRRAIGDTFWTRPVLVDGRPLLPSLPSHHTLSADTLSTRSFLVDGRPLAPFAAFPSHVLR